MIIVFSVYRHVILSSNIEFCFVEILVARNKARAWSYVAKWPKWLSVFRQPGWGWARDKVTGFAAKSFFVHCIEFASFEHCRFFYMVDIPKKFVQIRVVPRKEMFTQTCGPWILELGNGTRFSPFIIAFESWLSDWLLLVWFILYRSDRTRIYSHSCKLFWNR